MGKVMEVLKNGVVINRIMCPDDQPETVTLRNPAVATTPQDKAKFESLEKPITAARGMTYEYGKYYLDPEDGKTYLCKRQNETGTIQLDYLPHELILHYFVEA